MHTLKLNNFNLQATLESGQIFRWEYLNEWYYLTVGNTIIKIKQQGNKIFYDTSNQFDVLNFFDLKNKSYNSVLAKIGRTPALATAVKKYRGLRLINQQPWECTVSFICSSFSNIKRIKANLNSIARQFGKKIEVEGYSSYSFPTAAAIAKNSRKLKNCGLGYRAKYISATSKTIASNYDFTDIKKGSYAKAKQKIMELDGVGEKVADCILLFSLGFTQAFPVDVWIAKAMRQQLDSKTSLKQIAEAGRQTFGKNAGYAQQFLYHHIRNANRKL